MNHMDDEPTRMGAVFATEDDPTRLRTPETYGSSDWYRSSPLPPERTDRSDRTDRGAPAVPSKRRPWVVVAALLGVAAIGFGGVSAVLATRSHSPAAGSGKAAVSPVSYPSGATQDCVASDGSTTTLQDDAVSQAGESKASCRFLVATKEKVWAHVPAGSGESSYSTEVLSEFLAMHPRKGRSKFVTLHCATTAAVTTCTGGDPTVTIYVRPKS